MELEELEPELPESLEPELLSELDCAAPSWLLAAPLTPLLVSLALSCPALLEADTFELVCQVNGKVRDRVPAPAGASREELEALAREAPNVRAHLDGHELVKVIVVPAKLVNFVVR